MKTASGIVATGVLAGLASIGAVESSAQTAGSRAGHVTVAATEIKWKPLRPGAEIAVVSGDPDRPGALFVIRFRYTGVVRVPPHWHPTDEHLTVLSGTFMIGMGERFDESAATQLTTGAYATIPAKMAHYGWSKGDTLLQIHGTGPFAINYVNPADDPNRKDKK